MTLVGERLDDYVAKHWQPNDRERIPGWCGVNDELREAFLKYLKENYPEEVKDAQQVLVDDFNNIDLQSKRLDPLFPKFMEDRKITPQTLCGLNSDEGAIMELDFQEWTQKNHPEIYRLVTQWDSVHAIEYDTSFGATIMNF